MDEQASPIDTLASPDGADVAFDGLVLRSENFTLLGTWESNGKKMITSVKLPLLFQIDIAPSTRHYF